MVIDVYLKPCPFCGGRAEYEATLNIIPIQDEGGAYVDADMLYWEKVHCTQCGVEIVSDSDDEEEEITIKKWNQRISGGNCI